MATTTAITSPAGTSRTITKPSSDEKYSLTVINTNFNNLASIANETVSQVNTNKSDITSLKSRVSTLEANGGGSGSGDSGSLTGYATEEYVQTELENYVTSSDLTSTLNSYAKSSHTHSNYLTTTTGDNRYYTKTIIDEKGYLTKDEADDLYASVNHEHTSSGDTFDLSDYATKTYVTEQLTNYAEKDHVHTIYASSSHTHSDYVTTDSLENQLNNYVTSEEWDDEIGTDNDASTIKGRLKILETTEGSGGSGSGDSWASLGDGTLTTIAIEFVNRVEYTYPTAATSITITIPDDGFEGEMILHFRSGGTATTFTVPDSVLMAGLNCYCGKFYPTANTQYTIMFDYNGTDIVGFVGGYGIG